MKVEIDHLVLPSNDKDAAAKMIAELFEAPWEPSKPILRQDAQKISGYEKYRSERASVYLNSSFTLDFIDSFDKVAPTHICFKVTDEDFEAAISRLRGKGISFKSEADGPVDNLVNQGFGGKRIYWNDPDNQNWEMLTKSYARQSK